MAGAYIPLDSSDVVLSTDSVTSAMWSDNSPTLLNYFTSSAQVASAVAPILLHGLSNGLNRNYS